MSSVLKKTEHTNVDLIEPFKVTSIKETESPVLKLGGKTVACGWQYHRHPEWQEDSEKHIY